MTAIAIVAHINRRAMAEQLAETVAASRIFYDDGTLGCNANHGRVWQHHADNPTEEWSVVLEDDAVPVPGFRDQLEAALTAAPTPIVSLYLGTSRPLCGWQTQIKQTIHAIRQTRAAWITSTHLLHCVGVAIQTPLLPSLLESLPQIPLPIDEAISVWANQHNHQIGYTWPSIIDHADGPTLVDHADGRRIPNPRRAWRAVPRHQWNNQTITMPPPFKSSAFLTGTAVGRTGRP